MWSLIHQAFSSNQEGSYSRLHSVCLPWSEEAERERRRLLGEADGGLSIPRPQHPGHENMKNTKENIWSDGGSFDSYLQICLQAKTHKCIYFKSPIAMDLANPLCLKRTPKMGLLLETRLTT